MNAVIYFFVGIVCTLFPSTSNQIESDDFCLDTQLHQAQISINPVYAKQHLQFEALIFNRRVNKTYPNRQTTYTIPVVFHIIHENGPENIPDSQIQLALEWLNQSYSNTGYYDPNTGVDIAIQFCLAQRDPNGDATNGITRNVSALTNVDAITQDLELKNLNRWATTDYMNIWVVKEICHGANCGTGGYAYSPAAHGFSIDGIVIEERYIGTTEAQNTVLTHEIGHYLGLYHTFEGGCENNDCLTQGDRVCDTPPDNTTSWVACDVVQNSCSSDEDDLSDNNPFRPVAQGGLGDQTDQFENYMDYSSLNCNNIFTQGQKDLMRIALVEFRSSLLASPGCLAPCLLPVEVGFNPSLLEATVGSTLTFENTSVNANSYDWYVNDVLVSSATDLEYTFTEAENYIIKLVANSSDSLCFSKETALSITIYCPVAVDINISDTTIFAGASLPIIGNVQGADSQTWTINGVPVSEELNYTLNTTNANTYQICLEAGQGSCSETTCIGVQAVLPNSNTCEYEGIQLFGPNPGRIMPFSLAQANDGGMYIGGGKSQISSAGFNAWFGKLDPFGQSQWSKKFNGSEFSAKAVIDLVEDGDYLLGIITQGTITPQSHHASVSYCFKFDMISQELVWFKKFSSPESPLLKKIANPLNTSYYIIVGTGQDENYETLIHWIQLDKNSGEVIATNRFKEHVKEVLSDLVLFEDAAYTAGYVKIIEKEYPRLTKFDLNGNLQWSKIYEVSNTTFLNLVSSAIVVDQSGILFTGYDYGIGGSADDQNEFYYFKTDLTGNILWFKPIYLGKPIKKLTNVFIVNEGYIITGKTNNLAPGASDSFFACQINNQGEVTSLKETVLPIVFSNYANAGPAEYRDGTFTFTDITGGFFNDNPGVLLYQYNPSWENCIDWWQDLSFFASAAFPAEIQSNLVIDPDNTPNESLDSVLVVPSGFTFNDECGFEQACHEICTNGVDDDGDNLIDCSDPDCDCFVQEECPTTFAVGFGEVTNTIFPVNDQLFLVGGGAGGLAIKSSITLLNNKGEIAWQRTFDFPSNDDMFTQIILEDNGYLLGINSDVIYPNNSEFTPTTGAAFLYDWNNHIILWAQQLDNGSIRKVLINPINGNFIAIGNTENNRVFMMELDPTDGSNIWQKTYQSDGLQQFLDAEVTEEVIFIAGENNAQASLTALDLNGNILYSKSYLEDATNANCCTTINYNTILTADGLINNFVQTQATTATTISGLFKVDLVGNLIWAKTYALEGYPQLLLRNGLLETSNGFYVYGDAISDLGQPQLVLIKTDETGHALWAKGYGGDAATSNYVRSNSELIEVGDFLYLTGRTNASLEGLFLKVGLDGDLINDDCHLANSLNISTQNYPNPSTNEEILEEVVANLVLTETEPEISGIVNSAVQKCPLFDCDPDYCTYDFSLVVDSSYCYNNNLALTLSICNLAEVDFQDSLAFTLYDLNPTIDNNAQAISTFYLEAVFLDSLECKNLTVSIPYPNTSNAYIILNDNGSITPSFNLSEDFPSNFLVECDYSNNLDSFSFEYIIPEFDLGPDTTLCENSTITLNAGNGFSTYLWPGAVTDSIFTIYEPGIFWVAATTVCGDVVTDTIRIDWDTIPNVTFDRPLAFICLAESLELTLPDIENYTYQWSPSAGLSCLDCPNPTVSPMVSTTYTYNISNESGCYSGDTIRIEVIPCDNFIQTGICLGDTIPLYGELFYPGRIDTIFLAEDSILYIETYALDTFYTSTVESVCFGTNLEYEGEILPPGTTQTFPLTASNGCDSTVKVSVQELPPIETITSMQICQGDSIELFGSFEQEAAAYSTVFTASNGCDSIFTVELTVLDTPEVNLEIENITCLDKTAGSIFVNSNENSPLSYSLDGQLFTDDPLFAQLTIGDYTIWVQNQAGCLTSLNTTIEAPNPLELYLPEDQFLQLGDTFQIKSAAIADFELNYQWSPDEGLNCADCPNPVAQPFYTTTYQLTIEDINGCTISEEIKIIVDRTPRIYIPNAFSPNGDGYNDLFQIYPGPEVAEILAVKIFSRWGALVFEANNLAPQSTDWGWDGQFNGEVMQSGVYVYLVEVRLIDGEIVSKSGDVLLIK